ncbi:MAG: pyrimidine dimer DNA glycosylase/endonuclease V [Steroidobacteraceae bacterium]
MRLWSLHPRYLDSRGLVALWREALLAREVLRGNTRGYLHHPQLHRFRGHPAPLSAIELYLESVYCEARERGFAFDRRKLGSRCKEVAIAVSHGQLQYEWDHLLAKLRRRSPSVWRRWADTPVPEAHPLFRVRSGPVEAWERQWRLRCTHSSGSSWPSELCKHPLKGSREPDRRGSSRQEHSRRSGECPRE